ncbi:MAG: phosphotransferase [Oligoflexia bacterium]|nr:phosphotransferase [Oligoflexia bacterium]
MQKPDPQGSLRADRDRRNTTVPEEAGPVRSSPEDPHDVGLGGPARTIAPITQATLSTAGGDFRGLALELAWVADVVNQNWSVGRVVGIEKITRGVANDSFFIDAEKDGARERYFLRIYAAEKKEWWLQLEHDVLTHLTRHNFQITPVLITCSNGGTYASTRDAKHQQRFAMLTNLLTGEDKYAHEKNDLPYSELESVGKVFARYHNLVSLLISERYSPAKEPTEARMLRKLRRRVEEIPGLIAEIRGHSEFEVAKVAEKMWPSVKNMLAEIPKRLPPSRYLGLPHLPIHHDLHPGNMLFSHGEVSGLFDFDYVKVDARAYDVGLAAVFFGTRWVDDPNLDGQIDKARFARFISAYQHPANMLNPDGLAYMQPAEIDVLPEMMQIGNGILIYWFINDFAQRLRAGDVTSALNLDQEYSRCLRHRMATSLFIEGDRPELLAIAREARLTSTG